MSGRAASRASRSSTAAARARPARRGSREARAATATRLAAGRGAPAGRAARARAAGVLDALLQGRGWIALVGALLVGIVFFNVDLLQLNRDIARTAERSATIKRENARLRLELARLASTERIQTAAAGRGLVLPPAGEVRYVRVAPAVDARRAASRLSEPGKGMRAPAASQGGASAPPPPAGPPASPPGTAGPPAPAPGAPVAPSAGQPVAGAPPAGAQGQPATPPAPGAQG